MSSKQRIFDSIEHLNHEFNLNVVIPKGIPEGCNVICYNTANGSTYLYKEEDGFLHYFAFDKTWRLNNSETLEGEVERDKDNDKLYAYLRLATKDNSDVFTPERLLGVETTKGFITNVVEIGFLDIMNPSYYVYTTESLSKEDLYDVHNIKYYISDDSDETVSFREYIGMFYEGGVCA